MSSQESIWHMPPSRITLEADEIHIWRVSLTMSQGEIDRFSRLLASDEQEKAGRYRFEKDRNQFIIGRGLLRTLLGCYLGCEPRHVSFRYSSYGKPSLGEPLASSGLQFNLSHSHQLALLAFTYTRDIGIDIEYMRPNVEFEQLAEHFFAPEECAVLRSVAPSARAETFYNCWTRKEAYIKARGEGLSIPLASFDVSLRPGEPAALLQSREDPAEVPHWSLHALFPGEHYAAALAIKDNQQQPRCWQWLEGTELAPR